MSGAPGPLRWRHVAALLRLGLVNLTRPPLDTETGRSRGHPALALVVSNGLLGLLFSANAQLTADLRSYALLVYTAGLSVCALSLLPEPLEHRRRRLDLLYTRPASDRSFAVARALQLGLLSTLVLTSFSTAPFARATLELGASAGQVARLWLGLVAAGFTVGVAFNGALVFAARWLAMDGLRRVALALLAALMVAASLLASLLRHALADAGSPRLDLGVVGWVRALPSSWYVDLALGAQPGAQSLAPLAALATAAALLGASRNSLDAAHPRYAERLDAASGRRPGRPVALWVVDALFETPAGRWLGGGEVHAVASLILLLAHREDVSRLRGLALRWVTLGVAVMAVALEEPAQFVLLGGVLGAQNLAEGRSAAAHSPNAAASFIFGVTPVRARSLSRGTALALFVGHQAPTLLLMSAALFLERPWPTALAMSVALGLLGLTCAHVLIGAAPRRPLSEEPRLAPVFTNLGWTLAFGASHALSCAAMGSLPAAALGALVFAATALLAERWAAARMAAEPVRR